MSVWVAGENKVTKRKKHRKKPLKPEKGHSDPLYMANFYVFAKKQPVILSK